MIGSDKLDISIENLWRCWRQYKVGKKKTIELLQFEYFLEKNLAVLGTDLGSRKYKHGAYYTFEVKDNKPRKISVASIRDRIVHRLIYEYLVGIFDRKFDFDVWSCRKEKGLIGAIQRCHNLEKKYSHKVFWRADVSKFFESVDKEKLFSTIAKQIQDKKALWLIHEIIFSFKKGISIGNLTSQIFANIYLNEFDRFVRNSLKPPGYLRYGDDFVIFEDNFKKLDSHKILAESFLFAHLKPNVHQKNNFVGKVSQRIKFLGCRITPREISLNSRNKKRLFHRLNYKNISSYFGLVQKFGDKELKKKFAWKLFDHT